MQNSLKTPNFLFLISRSESENLLSGLQEERKGTQSAGLPSDALASLSACVGFRNTLPLSYFPTWPCLCQVPFELFSKDLFPGCPDSGLTQSLCSVGNGVINP